MRRQYDLSEGDTQYLGTTGLNWETVLEGGVRRVIVHTLPVPPGYNHTEVSVHLRLEAGYPDTQIDMAYFHPPLERSDGVGIRATATEQFDGKAWQRWSRHRTATNAWRVGVDDISSHMALVEEWLKLELEKK